MEYVSNCCGEPLLFFHDPKETAICSFCKEHCMIVEFFNVVEAFEWLEENGYEGTDLSMEIALYEYDVIVKDLGEGKFDVIYRSRYSETLSMSNSEIVARQDMTDAELKQKLIDLGGLKDGFLSFNGTEIIEEFNKLSFVNRLADMLRYYGELNVFGDPQNTSTIDQMVGEIVNDMKGIY